MASKSLIITGLSYSTSLRTLLPPPYDTNCCNYAKDGFKSQFHCFTECIRNKTMEKNFLLNHYLIDEEKTKQFNLSIFPYARIKDKETLDRYVEKNRKNYLGSDGFFLESVFYANQVEEGCKKSRGKLDCFSEVITTTPIPLTAQEIKKKQRSNSVTHLINVNPPKIGVIQVVDKLTSTFASTHSSQTHDSIQGKGALVNVEKHVFPLDHPIWMLSSLLLDSSQNVQSKESVNCGQSGQQE